MAAEVLQKCAKLASEPMQTNEQQAMMCTERKRGRQEKVPAVERLNCIKTKLYKDKII